MPFNVHLIKATFCVVIWMKMTWLKATHTEIENEEKKGKKCAIRINCRHRRSQKSGRSKWTELHKYSWILFIQRVGMQTLLCHVYVLRRWHFFFICLPFGRFGYLLSLVVNAIPNVLTRIFGQKLSFCQFHFLCEFFVARCNNPQSTQIKNDNLNIFSGYSTYR